MLEAWTHLPKWLKFGMAAAVLGHSTYYATVYDIVWPWGFGIGGLLLVMSFMQPLGPQRRKAPPPAPRPNAAGRPPRGRPPEAPASKRRAAAAEMPPQDTIDDDWRPRPMRDRPNPKWHLLGGLLLLLFAGLVVAQMIR